MTDPFNQHVRRLPPRWQTGLGRVVPPIKLANGELLSVQASRIHACTPRDDLGPYTSFEVGAADPGMFPELFGLRVDGADADSHHHHVPLAVLLAIADRCGGIKK